ncbi:hypothetical protein [Aureibaculum conchae]|uniref:hypothetical protein n=1 Tax=Aureibaculum sp. 2308TA14-22 TaxID=3108392 RepID=UPI003399F244
MKKFKVEANELLQRNELKSVFGGNADEGCTNQCSLDSDCAGDPMRGLEGYCKDIPCMGEQWKGCDLREPS